MSQTASSRLRPDDPATLRSLRVAWLVLPGLTILVVLLAALRIHSAWPSTPLFVAINLLVAPVSLIVAFLAARTYLADGSRSVLLWGSTARRAGRSRLS